MARPALVRLAMSALGVLSSNVSTPPSGLQDDGYTDGDKPLAEHHNNFFGRVSQWLLWIDTMWPEEHDDNGHHTDVWVQTLDVESTRSIRYVLGEGAQSSRAVMIPLGSPDKGGWCVVSGTLVDNSGSTPPNAGLGAGAGTLIVQAPIPMVIGQEDSSAGDQWIVDKLWITYKRVGTAGNSFTWYLLSQLADGTGAYVIEATGTLTSATVARAAVTPAEAVDPARRYFVRLTLVQGGGAAAEEVIVSNVDAECPRKHLE